MKISTLIVFILSTIILFYLINDTSFNNDKVFSQTAQTNNSIKSSATAKANIGDYQGAIEEYNKAIKLNPNDAGLYLERAKAKKALGDVKGAKNDLLKSKDLYSQVALITSPEGVDMRPYMNALERKIKSNWRPNKKINCKLAKYRFTIARNGTLVNMRLYKSSGNTEMDNSCNDAINQSLPFEPLPVNVKASSIEVEFTFDLKKNLSN